ncbi:unnamed protein product, partial [marine sediment metagenome]
DYTEETGRVLTQADCGLGNDIYKTLFSVLYGIAPKAEYSPLGACH